MKLTSYSLTIGETVNLGNFNSARYEVAGTIVNDEGVTTQEVEELRTYLKDRARETRSNLKA